MGFDGKKLSHVLLEGWRWSTIFLSLALIALSVSLSVVLFDKSGSHTFTWDEDLTVGMCSHPSYAKGHQYSKMCTNANDLQPFGQFYTENAISTLLSDAKDGDPPSSHFNVACYAFRNIVSGGELDASEDDDATADAVKTAEEALAKSDKAKITITQTLDQLCARFDQQGDPFLDTKMCLELERDPESGKAISQYLTTVEAGAYVFVALFAVYIMWLLFHFNEMRGTENMISLIIGKLTPKFKDGNKITRFNNWVTHTLLMAAIHIYSVLLAVFSAQAVEHYDNSDVAMNIDMVKKCADQTSNDNKDCDYTQRREDCFSSVPGFYLWNIAQKSEDKDMKDAPAITQAIFNLSIIVAVLSGLCLFCYLYFKLASHYIFKDGQFNTNSQFSDVVGAVRKDKTVNTAQFVAQSNVQGSVGAGIQGGSRFGVGIGSIRNSGHDASLPSSVIEEKNDGEMFDSSVQKGASILSLQF